MRQQQEGTLADLRAKGSKEVLDETTAEWPEAQRAWASAIDPKTGKYNYRSPGHRQWRKLVCARANRCYICRSPFKLPSGRRRRRQHAHHIYGARRSAHGLSLCASCHDAVTILSKAYIKFSWTRLRQVANWRNDEIN